MLASSERTVKRSGAVRGRQGALRVGAQAERRNNSKALIGQIEKALQGLGGIGLKCPLARTCCRLPFSGPAFGASVSCLLLNKPAFVCVCPGGERTDWGEGEEVLSENRPPECFYVGLQFDE